MATRARCAAAGTRERRRGAPRRRRRAPRGCPHGAHGGGRAVDERRVGRAARERLETRARPSRRRGRGRARRSRARRGSRTAPRARARRSGACGARRGVQAPPAPAAGDDPHRIATLRHVTRRERAHPAGVPRSARGRPARIRPGSARTRRPRTPPARRRRAARARARRVRGRPRGSPGAAALRAIEQRSVGGQPRHAELGHARLARAEHLALAAQLEVDLGQPEAVGVLGQRPQAARTRAARTAGRPKRARRARCVRAAGAAATRP